MADRQTTAVLLSRKQLNQIIRDLENILERSKALDPSIPQEAEQLYFQNNQVDYYVRLLERSFRKARIKELGLSIASLPTYEADRV